MTKPTRRMLYLRIDDAPNYDHEANLQGLRAAASRWGHGLEVEDLWLGALPDLNAKDLLDKQVFALFFAGSFPEWITYGENPDWAHLLDHLAQLVHETTVPTLAVCGSHQAVARGYKDWSVVGHMVQQGKPPALISQELASTPSVSQIPSPRIGEVGTFPYAIGSTHAQDPLFYNLSGKLLHFTQSHHDKVEHNHSPAFVQLLSSARDKPAVSIEPIAPEDRVGVVALCLGTHSRILYTLQFHPELASHPSFSPEQAKQAAELGNDGEQLLLNFFDIAESYWHAQGVDFAGPSGNENFVTTARRAEQAANTARRVEQAATSAIERIGQATSHAVERLEQALAPLFDPLQQAAERTAERAEKAMDDLLARAHRGDHDDKTQG